MNGEIVAGRVHAQIRAGADFYYRPLLSLRRVSRDSPREVGREALSLRKMSGTLSRDCSLEFAERYVLYVSQHTLANAI